VYIGDNDDEDEGEDRIRVFPRKMSDDAAGNEEEAEADDVVYLNET
jgi:hypothetical protein